MLKNYYLFQQQISEIKPQLIGTTIDSVYTIHKNELIFDLHKEQTFSQLAISIDRNNPYILLGKHINHKCVRYNNFETLYGMSVSDIEIVPNNKFIIIKLDTYVINIFFYGNFPNITVHDFTGILIDSFKSIKSVSVIQPPTENLTQKEDDIILDFILNANELTIKELIKELFPAFNNHMLAELYIRLNYKENDLVNNLDKQKIANVLLMFKNEITSGNAYIYRKNEHTKYLLLYISTLLNAPDYQLEKFESVNKAWSIFIRENQNQDDTEKLIRPILKAINKRKHVLQTTLTKLEEAEDIESRKQDADLKGNLIIANKHKIPRGAAIVQLINIFSEKQEKIDIKLNPQKTAVENATYYFQKYKNIAEKKQVIEVKKNTYSRELEEISSLEEKTQQARTKDLLKIKEQLEEMNILQAPVLKEKTKQSLKYAFKRLILDNSWDIYIGKNNQNNEQLTFDFANKWDIWLHAQGVSGSHVIIKLPAKNVTTPKHIIERAAEIAAYNSKAKHSSTVPVIYTEVRHVSKIRGAQAGTVNVKNEKVIFVKPLNLNQ